jgi:hypothetical protein
MKIEGPGSLRNAAAAQRVRPRSGAGGFRVEHGADEAPTAGVSSAGPTLAVASLLSLQEAPNPTDGRSRGLQRGRDLLDQLDRIRLALLGGQIAPSRLEALMRSLNARRAEGADPALAGLLDEIELRCAVELAKFERLRAAAPDAA